MLNNFIPEQWRDIVIVPIPKPGRDPSSLSAWRPISMMSCLCKVFHNILGKRLEWFCEKNQLFSFNTTGFRKANSCLDNLSCFVTRVLTGFSERKPTIACFIDISIAYNNVDITSLVITLDRLGVGSKLCSYIWNFLRHRNLHLTIDNIEFIRSTNRGLAQGDPLSPLLFNIVTHNICTNLNVDGVVVSQYADDFLLYTSCRMLMNGTRKLQTTLNNMVRYLLDVGLEISPSKTKVCLFKRGFRRESVHLKICNNTLQTVETVKYLGVWLDRSLRWSKQINELKERVLSF